MLTADKPKPKPRWRGYTYQQLQKCAEREVRCRQGAYPGYVARGRYTAQKAAQEVDMMRVIGEVLGELAESERLI